MTLATALAAEATQLKKGPRCKVCALLERLQPADRDALAGALGDPAFQHTQIERALRAEGYEVAAYGIARHRRNECAGV